VKSLNAYQAGPDLEEEFGPKISQTHASAMDEKRFISGMSLGSLVFAVSNIVSANSLLEKSKRTIAFICSPAVDYG
jgi:hypothetical protein